MSSDRAAPFRPGEDWSAVLTALLEAFQDGPAPDLDTWLHRYPRYATELEDFFVSREYLDRWAAPLRSAARAALGARERAGDTPGESGRTGEFHPLLPRGFGDYDLLEVLGKGGMGIVYRARQRSLQRLVALKMVRPGVLETPAELERFRQEAETVALLEHPGIVPVHEVGAHEGRPYFTMRLVAGGSLAEHLDHFRKEPKAAARLVAEVARAVHHAHQRGVLHRDLKPSNILLDAEGRPHVTDFGLAKRVVGEASLTETGVIVGTPGYMAPEQATGKRGAVTTATDVYGLGTLLYALLTGTAPFQGETPLETLQQVREHEPRPPSSVNRRVDRELQTICLKCLDKDAAQRYPSAEAVAEDLERWLAGEPVQARRSGLWRRMWKWARRRPALAALLAFSALTLAAGFLLLWRERNDTLSALQDVEIQRARAEERELLGRRQLYAADIATARRAWEVANLGVVQPLLEKYIPSPGEEDLRGFEWYYLWSLCQGRKKAIRTLRGHTGEVYCVHFSPDGKLLATAGQDHAVRLWDAATGRALAVLRGHTDEVNCAAFSPDGSTLASAGDDGAVKLWDPRKGLERKQLFKSPVKVVGVVYSPDGKILAAGLHDGTVHWWDLPSERERPPFQPHATRCEDIAFSPDGQTLATCGNCAALWEAGTGKLVRVLATSADNRMNFVCFTHRGDAVASTGVYSQVQLWDIARWRPILTFANGTHWVRSVAFSADDRILATAGQDGLVRLFEARTGKLLDLLAGHSGQVWSVAFSPDNRTLATAGKDGTVQLWDPEARENRMVLPGSSNDFALAFSPDGKKLIGGWDHWLKIWDLSGGRLEASLPNAHLAMSLSIAPDGRTLATGHRDNTVSVWDLERGRPRLTFQVEDRLIPGKQGPAVTSVAFTRDGESLLISSSNGFVREWDVTKGLLRRVLIPPASGQNGLAYCPSRNMVATIAGSPGVIHLCDLASGSLQSQPWTGPGLWPEVGAFSPDGTLLAIRSDNNVVLWDVAAGRPRASVMAHQAKVGPMSFSPDGRTLVSRSQEVKLWSTLTGQELLALEEASGFPSSLAFSPDGRMLAISGVGEGGNGHISLWVTPDGPPVKQPDTTSGSGAAP